MSRIQKFSRTNKNQQHETDITIHNDVEDQGNTLPPRRKKYPSSKAKLTRMYYNVVFVLFVALVVFLLWYGNSYHSHTAE